MRPSALFVSLCALLFAVAARAQSVHWELPDGPLAVNQQGSLQLVFDGCEPKGNLALPKVEGLVLQQAGTSSNMSMVNGSFTRSYALTFAAMLSKKEPTEIPAFSVDTDKGRLRVAALSLAATPAKVGQTTVPLETITSSRLETPRTSVWLGEVFPLNYSISAEKRYAPQFIPTFDWSPEPLVVEDWSKPELSESVQGGDRRVVVSYKTRGFSRTPGSFRLNAASQLVNLSTGMTSFGFFQQPKVDQYSVTSTQPLVDVKPLPPAPAGFTGAVGDFKLTSKVVPLSAGPGEPITWTLELSGTGNWPDVPGLPARDVSRDFQVVQPQAKRAPAEGKLFDVTLSEDVVLVPTKPGNYTLAPVSFVYFDPKSGTYKTLTTPRAAVAITGPTAPPLPVQSPQNENSSGSSSSQISNSKSQISSTPPSVPAPPAALPREPLPSAGLARMPWDNRTLLALVAAPFVALAFFWLWLALRRAHRTDPLRAQREARARLLTLLADMRGAAANSSSQLLAAPKPGEGASTLHSHLLAWQHDTAVLWQIAHAAPAATALPDSAWADLWRDADRALYAASSSLPADWLTRADAALTAKRLPRFSPLRLFLPKNLLPFAAALTIALLVPPSLRAEDTAAPISNLKSPISNPVATAAAYRAGNFPAAEKSWRDTLAKSPTDSAARHNLSLALAQQDQWAESTAQASVAFVQSPASDAIRAQLALASEKAGFVPAPLAELVTGTSSAKLAALASPSEWQLALVTAAVLIALAIATVLAASYEVIRVRWVRPVAWSVFALALLFGGAAWLGLRAYGVMADTRVVIAWHSGVLRSIPTEADTAQKTTPLPAGSVALGGKTFLGWVHLTFENGQTGWVRKEELVPVWQ